MPNYSLVVTPQYNPMSYEQYIAPFREYAGVYNQMADAYDKLEGEANQWEKLAQNAKDKPEYDQYKRYAEDLRTAANDLASNGLSQKTRGALSGLYQRYAKEIKPIEEKFNYRQKMIDEQRKLNPTGDIQFDRDYSQMGLSDFNLGDSYSGRSLSDIEKEAYDQAVALSSRRLSAPAKTMANQYFSVMQGFSAEEAADWLDAQRVSNPEAYNEVQQLIEDIHTQTRGKYNVYGQNTPYSQEQDVLADQSIVSGIMKGLTRKDDYQTNRAFDLAMRRPARGGGSTERTGRLKRGIHVKAANTKHLDSGMSVEDIQSQKYYRHTTDAPSEKKAGKSHSYEELLRGDYKVVKGKKEYDSSKIPINLIQDLIYSSGVLEGDEDNYEYIIGMEDANGLFTGDDIYLEIYPKDTKVVSQEQDVDENAL